MTRVADRARDLVNAIVASPGTRRVVFAGHSEAIEQLADEANAYRLIARATGRLVADLRDRLGTDVVDSIRRLYARWQVTPEQADAYRRLMRGELVNARGEVVKFIGSYRSLREAIAGTPLAGLLEADHILEQRIQRMLRDGPMGHAARSVRYAQVDTDAQRAIEHQLGAMNLFNGTASPDGLAVLVPANEIVARGLIEHLGEAPWFYVHQGIGSKTAMMRNLLPYRTEGNFSYQQILDATRWVTCHLLDLPREVEELIRLDMVQSIMHAVEEDELARAVVIRNVRPRRLSNEAIEEALLSALNLDPLTPARFANWPKVSSHVGFADEIEAAENALMRLLDIPAD